MRAYEKEPANKVFGEPEVVELGLDHDGNRQWFLATREGFEEVGDDGVLQLDRQHFQVGTRITLQEPLPFPVGDGPEDHDCGEDVCVCRDPA